MTDKGLVDNTIHLQIWTKRLQNYSIKIIMRQSMLLNSEKLHCEKFLSECTYPDPSVNEIGNKSDS